ncbi:MAG: SDR family NAD(P)-dependent oxidoreductase [Hyphomicrobium sp.]
MPKPNIALVTGGNRGIGREIVRQLARAGLVTVLGARDAAKGAAAAADIRAKDGLTVTSVALDVTDDASIAAAVRDIEKRHGPIDVLVNNAAILIDKPNGFDASLFEMTAETMRATFETNVIAPSLLMKAIVPGMRERGYGRVVNVSSTAGQLAEMGAGFPAYRTSKAALNAVTRIAAAEVGRGDVKINAMNPGWVRTDMGGKNAPRSVAEGAETAVWLATLPSDGPTGGFFEDNKTIPW